jgi:hypothetical protein
VVGPDHRISRPVRLETVEMISVKERTRGSAGIVLPTARVVTGLADPRYDPVPVQDGDIGVLAGRGVPAQQVVVVRTDFPDPVMVPDVVEIGLG